jgi:AcrR family transcriptional regulator
MSKAPSPWARTHDRERAREVKRDAVILAAAQAFREHGYHNTSLDDVAARLSVTKPTLYYYVSNKEEMLFECFRAGLDRIAGVFEELRGSRGTARAKLEVVIERYVEAVTSEFGWCMVRAEDQDLSPAMGARIKALKSEIDQGIRRLLREGREDGSIRECDPKMTSFAIAGALNWIGHWYREGEPLSPAEIAARFTEAFVLGLVPRAAIHSTKERTAS